jgi:hypothetical protein
VLLSHDFPLKAAVVAATLAADYIGTWSGVMLSKRKAVTTTPVQVQLTPGAAASRELLTWLKRKIRFRGDQL